MEVFSVMSLLLRRALLTGLFALGALSILGAPVTAQHPHFARGRLLVQFRANADRAGVENALANVHSRGHHPLGTLDVESVDLEAGQDESQAVAKLRANPNVEFAELDAVVPAADIPNDPSYNAQWFLPDIGCPQAWDITTGSTN